MSGGKAIDSEAVRAIDASGVVAILRGPFLDRLDVILPALADSGVRAIEISLTSPDAYAQLERAATIARRLDVADDEGAAHGASSAGTGEVRHAPGAAVAERGGSAAAARAAIPRLCIGAGTVRTPDEVRRVHDLGLSFIVTPVIEADVIGAALERGLVPIPGAFTPTEVAMALRLGAPAVKLFPGDVLGPNFVRGVLAPMPGVKLVPTGGVTLELAQQFARAGAWAVGVGSPLVPVGAGMAGDRAELTARARAFVAAMRSAPMLPAATHPIDAAAGGRG